MPWKPVFKQEFSLFTFLTGSPVPRLNGSPVYLRQMGQITTILEIIGTSIGQGKSPELIVRFRPGHTGIQVCLKMNNGPLTTTITKLRVIALINQVQHDRARAKVKRHTGTDIKTGMAGQCQLCEAALFDCAHTNGSTRRRTGSNFSITPQKAIRDNRRQTINVDDMVDFWLSGDCHFLFIFHTD